MRQWQTLLNEDNVTVDINWRSILEFTIFELGTKQASEVKDLLFAVLKKNKDVAGELFNWLQYLYPNLCESWTLSGAEKS